MAKFAVGGETVLKASWREEDGDAEFNETVDEVRPEIYVIKNNTIPSGENKELKHLIETMSKAQLSDKS